MEIALPTVDPPLQQQAKANVLQMLSFLQEWANLGRAPIRNIIEDSRVIWRFMPDDWALLPGLAFDVVEDGENSWLKLDRVLKTPPPSVSEELSSWVDVFDDPNRIPVLKAEIQNPDKYAREETPVRKREEFPTLEPAFSIYLQASWEPWAAREHPIRQSIRLYHELFELKQKLERPGGADTHELVCGIGLSVWSQGNRTIRVPIVVQALEFASVHEDFAIRIQPRARLARANLDSFYELKPQETKVFDSRFKEWLKAHPEPASPFEVEIINPLLKNAAGEIDPSGSFIEKELLPEQSDTLVVSERWCILLQRRLSNYLLDDVNKLKERVELEGIGTGAVVELAVQVPDNGQTEDFVFRGVSTPGVSSENGPVRELYFPKPFNREQLQVVRLLETGNGVVLQGPPGTGKTHTIANIICHYLAEGKRVLVTSKDAPALQVLRSQLPSHIQNLTASILSSEREGLRDLEHSMQRITADVLQLPRDECQRDIEQLKAAIDNLHHELAQIDRDLGRWAAKNIDKVPPHLGEMQPYDLALEVLRSSELFEWFPDSLDRAVGWKDVKITSSFFETVREARRIAGDELLFAADPLINPDTFPIPGDMATLHRQLVRVRELTDELKQLRMVKPHPISSKEEHSAARAACDHLTAMTDILGILAEEPWIRQIVLHLNFPEKAPVTINSAAVRTHLERFVSEFNELHIIHGELAIYSVVGHSDALSDSGLAAAIERGQMGNSPVAAPLRPFKKELVKKLEGIRVNGERVTTKDQWEIVWRQLRLERQTKQLAHQWNTFSEKIAAPSVQADGINALPQMAGLLQQLGLGWGYNRECHSECQRHLGERFSDPPTLAVGTIFETPAEILGPFIRGLKIEIAIYEQKDADAKREDLRRFISELPPIHSKRAANFDQHWLGFDNTSPEEIDREWSELVQTARETWAKRDAFREIVGARNSLDAAGAKTLANRVATVVRVPESASDPVLPENMMAAWLWATRGAFLRHIDGREEISNLNTRRRVAEKKLSACYENIVAKQTWLLLNEQLKKETSLVQQLNAFVHALSQIGAGTGKLASHYRRLAQQHMFNAHRAVRCWIMPEWRISENLPAELELFDLVIIDEASQSDMLALPAIMRGRKILVVGDDKQVSPTAVGTTTTDIEALYHRYLADLPFGSAMDLRSSLYDLASVAFAGRMVRLREHFRCSESIIRFSSRQFYNDEIRCLRVPKADERLLPTLIDAHVSYGVRDENRKVNKAEAEEILREIQRIVGDPYYNNRSIGVVSLLGNEQSRLMFKLIQERLGEEVILRHRIRCGDAAEFQGSEFDIVFLSMVSSGRPSAVTARLFEQRFNVAMSRARDRVYLFRSVRPEDLSPRDLRFKLIQHFKDPGTARTGQGRELCESPFEEEVYDALANAGYKILTQVPASGFRIDLVVEDDLGRRLAVECDGAQFHQPHQWIEDLNRQRVLERAGWTFHRIWGPTFYRDKTSSIRELIAVLSANGIEHSRSDAPDLSGLTEYRELRLEVEPFTEPDPLVELRPSSPSPDEIEDLPEDYRPVVLAAASPSLNNDQTVRLQVGDTVEFYVKGEPLAVMRYTIIEGASNPEMSLINYQTPVARALLDHSVGDEVPAALPGGSTCLVVTAVSK